MNKLVLFGLLTLFLLPLGFSALADNLVNYYTFDEASGTNAADSVGNNPMTNFSGITVNQNGILNKSYLFAGLASNTWVGNPYKLGMESFTISVWVNRTTNNSGNNVNTIYSVRNPSSGTPVLELGIMGDDTIRFHMRGDNNLGYTAQITTEKVLRNNWAHIVISFNHLTNNMTIYLNGTLVKTGSYGGSGAITGTQALIGCEAFALTETFKGYIDEFALFQKAITPAEVTTMYNSHTPLTYAEVLNGGPITIIDFDLVSIFDNTTNHVQVFNKSFNLLLTGYNATGLTSQSITLISADAGLSATNLTSNVNYAITLTNTSVTNGNYSFFAYDPFNTSLNITFYITINDVKNITYFNTSTFFKFNTTQALNLTMYLDDGNLTCDDYFNFTMPAANITNRLSKSCELILITFNNSAFYEYEYYATNNRFGRIINTTKKLYINAYNLSIPVYNSTLANNSYTDIKWYLTTIPNYANSNQLISMSINFNGTTTNPTASGLNYSYINLLKTEKVIETLPFYLILNLTLGNESLIFNNSYTLTISIVQLDYCSVYTNKILNISIRNEENVNQLVSNVTLISYFSMNDIVIPLSVYNDSDGIINVCINTSVPLHYNATFIFSAPNYGATNKISREHFFINTYYNGSIQQQSFYKLSNTLALKKTFTLYDYNNRLLEGYIIRINRWYGDSSKTVAEAKTNNNGFAITYARYYDFAYYQIDVLNPSGSIVYSTGLNTFSAENNNIYLTAGSVSTYYSLFNEYEFDYDWNNNTKLFSSTISKLDGSDTSYYLRVYMMNGSIVCYKSNITSSWTAYCNVSNSEGVLGAQAFAINSDNRVVLLYTYYFENLSNADYEWGSFGVILTFIIILVLGFVGIIAYYPIAPLMASIGLFLSIVLKFIIIDYSVVISLIFGSIILSLFMMKRSV